jgi:hypothetical protein
VAQEESLTVSFSQISTYLKCRYRWYLEYKRRIRRYFVIPAMDLGWLVHAGIAQAWLYYAKTVKAKKRWHLPGSQRAAKRAIKKGYDDWLDQYGEKQNTEELKALAEVYQTALIITRNAIIELDLPSWDVLWYNGKPLIEMELIVDIDIPGWKGLRTFPDLVAKDKKYGGNWVIDWKVRKQFNPLDAEEVNLQFAIEQAVLGAHGVSTVGSIMYQIKATPPAQPKLNQDGSMSRVRIATTWDVYAKALADVGLNLKDYAEMKEKLDVPFYQLQRHFRGEQEIGAIWRQIVIPTAKEMTKRRRPIRNMGHMNCNNCWARKFCLGELRGEDTDFMLRTTYIDIDDPKKRILLDPEEFDLEE